MESPFVAVIDIGSNSIKLLVARKDRNGNISSAHYATIDARLGTGLSAARPELTMDARQRALEAVQTLLDEAARFSPAITTVVATSAVRDAANGSDFAEQVRAATGCAPRILSGDAEANLIGRGLLCDPAVRDAQDFEVFDLGGGSLECLRFRARHVAAAVSLPLGCVRLAEKFVSDAARPLPPAEAEAIAEYTRGSLRESGFQFGVDPNRLVIGTGGTLTSLRAILAARFGTTFDASDPTLTREQLREALIYCGGLPLAGRQQIDGLPKARADVFPTALATMLALAEYGNIVSFRTSLYNLRFGVAAELIEQLG